MIEITNLNFGYSRKKLLFQNLNLKLSGGHIYGLLGKNGAGKSTLLKNICGLAFPLSGSCKINGEHSSKRLPSTLQELYLVPEDIYVPAVSIRNYVKHTAKFYSKFNRVQFEKYLDEFEVPVESKLTSLSYGQQKKVIIAFGIATNTKLLIMDEPTNGLDIPSKAQFRKIVASAFDEDRCIIISTHQVRDLDNLIDRLVIVHENQIVLNKSIAEIEEKLSFKYITNKNDALYYETGMHGAKGIVVNSDFDESKVDIELLFNAVINKPLISETLN